MFHLRVDANSWQDNSLPVLNRFWFIDDKRDFRFQERRLLVREPKVPMGNDYGRLLRSFQNPAETSPIYKNLRFAGNFRTFPVLATTGSAMGSGWSAGMAVCRALGARPTPLSDVEAA